MLVGHVAAGLAAKALEPRLKLGTLLTAAMLLDIVFWLLVLVGVESTAVPADFSARHTLSFHLPYSHSLLSAVLLSVAFAGGWTMWGGRRARRAGAYWDGIVLIALVVFSHWVLDWLVHVSDMPLVPGGRGFGVGLWQIQPTALIFELSITVGAFVALVMRGRMKTLRLSAVGFVTFVLAALTALGAYDDTGPPDAKVFALTSLLLIALTIGIGAWADRSR